MRNRYDEPDPTPAVLGLATMLLELALLLSLAGFIVSIWVTRLLFEWLLLPWFPILKKHDGLVVLISGGAWSLITGLGIAPLFLNFGRMEVSPDTLTHIWQTSFWIGGIWGSLVAGGILIVWWEQISTTQPQAPLFAQVAGVDSTFFQPEPSSKETEEKISIEDLEAEFARLVQMETEDSGRRSFLPA